jgi:NitT/TauT family transport system permease protein
LLPKPGEVLNAFGDLWEQGLGAELITSFYLNIQAIAVSTVVSLLLAYATVMPFFRPIVALLSKLRFSVAGRIDLLLHADGQERP